MNHNATRNGERDGLKIMWIGQSAAKPLTRKPRGRFRGQSNDVGPEWARSAGPVDFSTGGIHTTTWRCCMWNKNHESCVSCSETSRPHFGGGNCRRCYLREYNARNKDLVSAHRRDWYDKNGGKHLSRKLREQRWFDGNRDAVLARDGNQCVKCAAVTQLVVHHKDHNGRGSPEPNNSMENLETLCRACHASGHRAADWSRVSRACLTCERSDRRHNAHGLCVACYSRLRRSGQLEDMVRSLAKVREA